MDILELYSSLTEIFNSPVFGIIATATVIYLGIIWIAVILWVARDIVHRSNNIFYQVVSILLGFIFIPGLILYLIIRPSRTLADKYDEELERRAFLESISETDEECQTCKSNLRREFIFCPVCRTQLKQVCQCGQIMENIWEICPRCGELKSKVEKKKVIKESERETKKSKKKTINKAIKKALSKDTPAKGK